MRALPLRLLSLAAGLFLAPVAQTAVPAAQLLLLSPTLDPNSTFEVRFASEMVAPDEVGKPAATSPLAFAPALPGQFVWLSSRSGTFVPERILPLGATYRITLRSGLKDRAGNPVPAKLRETAATPPFRVKGVQDLVYGDRENASVLPRHTVLFNANVDAAAARKFCRYVNAAGAVVPARVEQVTDPRTRDRNFNHWQSDDRNLTIWGENPAVAPEPADDEIYGASTASTSATPAVERRNLLYFVPEKPLPPGVGWRLVLEAGFPSASPGVKLPARREIEIGNIHPFRVRALRAESNRQDGRRLILELNKMLPEGMTAAEFAQWFQLHPAPANLKVNLEGDYITFQGDFALDTLYRVSLRAGLPAREPVTLSAPFTEEIKFSPIAPRLYFAEITTHQWRGGTRVLRLAAVNIARLRVSARLFAGDEIPVALKAFDKYSQTPDLPDEYYSRVPPDELPGQTIWEKEFTPAGPIDSEQTVVLPWDEIVGPGQRGVVLFTAESTEPVAEGGLRAGVQTLVQLTDLGAAWKRDQEHIFAHFFSLASGRSVPSLDLQLINTDGQVIAQTKTDATGNARLPHSDDSRWIFARSDSDAHLISVYGGESSLPLYSLGVSEEASDYDSEGRNAGTIFLFTDRGVYKPGDKLFLKGYARRAQHDQARLPTGQAIKLTLLDSKERELLARDVVVSEYGAFDQEIELPAGELGLHRIVAAGETGQRLGGTCVFQVQEYRPNAFEVLVPAPPETFGDTQLALPITAKYFMGKPLSKARLNWSLVARDDPFSPDGFSAFAFNNAIYDYRLNRALDRLSQFNAQGELPLGADGRAQVDTALPVNPKAPQPRAARLICEVTDLNQQTVSASRSFTHHSSAFYFGLRRFDNVIAAGKPLPVELIALQPDAKPLDAAVSASIRLTRIKWQVNRLATAGDTSDYESTPILEKIWERELKTKPGLDDDRRPAVARLDGIAADEPGQYLLEALGKDAAGRDVLTSLVFEVAGEVATDWNYRNPYVIDLVADKDSYTSGQTATLLVKTPISGDALVTVERGSVMRSFVVALRGNAPAVQVPIEERDGPNIFVSVLLLRGADESPRKIKIPEYRIGYASLKVAQPRDKLSVQVKTKEPTAKPGDSVHLEAQVNDSSGKTVGDAEITLYAVDEGVLSLTGYETPDPLSLFQRPRGLSVFTSLTLPTLLREDAPAAEFANKGYLIGDGKGGTPLLDGLRTNFVTTPFWSATLRTDAQGRARAEFKAPDSLTRYRVMAVATTKQSQFGAAQAAFEIKKPLMIESAMPAFANVGDQIVLRAVVHNATDTAGEAEVVLEVDPRVRAPERSRRLALAPQQSVAVDFPIEVIGTGDARWRWGVRFTAAGGVQLQDAMEARIKLGHPAPLVRQVETARVADDSAELLRIANPQILESTGEVAVHLSNTRVGQLREALHHLLTYPYGCLEQTVSSLLPWLTVRELRATLPEIAKTDEEINRVVEAGLRRIFSMQTGRGGLSYWPGDREPMLWGSAYGALAVALAQKQGFDVPEADFKRLQQYLSAQLRGTSAESTGYGLSDRCLAVYALAVSGAAEPAYHTLLAQKRANLSAEDRALVALAVLESAGPKELVEQLLAGPSIDAGYIEQWFGSITRENALQLLAWVKHEPNAPRVDQLATELFARRSNGHWQTTQNNVWSLLALADYLRKIESGPRESSGSIVWGDTSKTFSLSEASPAATQTFVLTPVAAQKALTLQKSGGQIFSEVTVSARPTALDHPRQEQGYRLTRRYAKIDDEGRLSPAEDLQVGDRVLVTLDIETRRRATYLALDDPLPSVLAAINPAFKSQEVLAGETLGTDWASDHSELRDDRALFFANVLRPGRHTLRYLARVVAAGEVRAPSAKIEEMYHPERFGTTETTRIKAKPLE